MGRAKNIKQGNPLDTDTMVGAQASKQQYDKIMGYMEIAKQEGAQILMGGGPADISDDWLKDGYYVQPTLLKGSNDMRVFQEEIFGPTLAVTTFKDEAEALVIANHTIYGLGAGVWTRDSNLGFRMARGIQAGRVWVNCYHAYPAHATFGGYKKSGIGRETHKVALEHYQQVKSVLTSYSIDPLGFF
jgi:aldehyde dehydrogenase